MKRFQMQSLTRDLIFALLIAVLVCIAPSTIFAAKQFRWKMKQGDKFSIELNQQFRQILTIGDQTIEIPNSMTMSMTWLVDDVNDDGEINLTQVIDRIQMTMLAPGTGEVEFDSASSVKPAGLARIISAMLKPMIGARFTQTMTNRGRILDLHVPKDALAGMGANPMLKQYFSDDSFKSMMRQASPVLPDVAVEKGYGWQSESENKTPMGTMKLDATYKYVGEDDKGDKTLDRFDITVKLNYEEPEDPAAPKVRITDQENLGAFYFDESAGHIVKTNMAQKVTMEVTVRDRTYDQRIETTVDMSVKRANGKEVKE